MDVQKKDHLTAAEQAHTIHAETHVKTQAEASTTHVTLKALAKNSPVGEKPQHEWGEVIVLAGTSTAGKSTIISELLKQKPGMLENGFDLSLVNIPMNHLRAQHSVELAYLERVIEPTKDEIGNSNYLLSYVEQRKSPNFKADVSVTDKELYKEVIQKLYDSLCEAIPGNSSEEYAQSIISCMIDDIILEAKRGRPVACDILQINEVALATLKMQLPSVKIALVYVPFQALAERVIARNIEAVAEHNFGNARPGVFPLEQFTKLFRPRNASDSDNDVVQKLTFSDMNHAIDTVFENSKAFLELRDPEHLATLQKETAHSKTIIYEKFGFHEGDDPNKIVELTPSYKGYHMLIDTAPAQKSKSEAVQEAVKKILVKH